MADQSERDRFSRLLSAVNQLSDDEATRGSAKITGRFKEILDGLNLENAAKMHLSEHDDMSVVLSCMINPITEHEGETLSGDAYVDLMVDVVSMASQVWLLSKAYYSELPKGSTVVAL
jgi:hypothetical protein